MTIKKMQRQHHVNKFDSVIDLYDVKSRIVNSYYG